MVHEDNVTFKLELLAYSLAVRDISINDETMARLGRRHEPSFGDFARTEGSPRLSK